MTEDRKNTEQHDVDAHAFRINGAPSEEPQDVEGHAIRYGGSPSEQPQDVEGHAIRVQFDPSDEPQDVEGHVARWGRSEDAPPAKPGTEGQDDDVEAHRYGGI